jgi:hypothetical protein
MRGARAGYITGGAGLILLDICGASVGRLPLKGRADTAIELADNPEIFWAYSLALGLLGLSALVWGLMRPK